MITNQQTHSFDKIAAELEDALSWIAAHGVSRAGDRFTRYGKLIKSLRDAFRAQDHGVLRSRDEDYTYSLYEAHELIRIHKDLVTAPNINGIADRLKKFAKGPAWRIEEKSTNASILGRNTAVELLAAGIFARGGYSIDLSKDEDVFAQKGVLLFSAECKRPSSPEKVIINVNDAIDQCNKRAKHKAPGVHSGLVVVDMSWVSNPKSDIYQYRDADQANAHVLDELKRISSNIAKELKLAREKAIAGVLVRFSALSANQLLTQLTYTDHRVFILNSHLEGDYANAVQEFAELLRRYNASAYD